MNLLKYLEYLYGKKTKNKTYFWWVYPLTIREGLKNIRWGCTSQIKPNSCCKGRQCYFEFEVTHWERDIIILEIPEQFFSKQDLVFSVKLQFRKPPVLKCCFFPQKVVSYWRSSSTIEDGLPSKVVFKWRPSSIKGYPPWKVVFHQRVSSIKGHFTIKVVYHQRLPSIKSHLKLKIVFNWRVSSIGGHLQLEVVFN